MTPSSGVPDGDRPVPRRGGDPRPGRHLEPPPAARPPHAGGRLSADRMAETIRGSTRDAMLRNDADGLHRVIANIGAQPGIARIRVFNKEGRIRTSTDPVEVGRLVDTRAEQCVACHQSGRPLDRLERTDRVRTFRGDGGQRVLGVIAPIHNEPQCHAMPSRGQAGAGRARRPALHGRRGRRSRRRRSARWWAAWPLTVAATVLAVAGLVWGMVLKPVRRLARAMRARVRRATCTCACPSDLRTRSGDHGGRPGTQ